MLTAMKIRIVVSYVPRYRRGHTFHFVPPITGIHLAALTPPEHEVDVVHEQTRAVPIVPDVDVVAISFFSGFARQAYAVADAYRALGVTVVLGGPHATYWTEEALAHADVVVTGEADLVWAEVLADIARGAHRAIYRGGPVDLADLPSPRFDLLEDRFVVRRVLQATRGCPFTCSFCTVPDLNPGFRVRPVDAVVRDVMAPVRRGRARPWDKLAWFWDDNLLVKRAWAKELLDAMTGLDRWWLTQASIDITRDDDLLGRMERSGCVGIFLGIESLDDADLASCHKRQNRATEYKEAIDKLHDRGICVMAGFISGFDDQTAEGIVRTADRLHRLGVDVPFLSILTPFRGTPLYAEQLAQGRILEDRDWGHYNGYNVAFRPARMTPDELLSAHRAQWRRAFSPGFVAERVARAATQLRPGAFMLSAAMNGFYGHKRARGNEPAVAARSPHLIVHPEPNDLIRLGRRRRASKNEPAAVASPT